MNEYRYIKLAIVFIIALILALVGYGIYINSASIKHIEKMIAQEYALLIVDEAEYRDIHAVTENIDINVKTSWKIDVQSQAEGTVVKVLVAAGERVKAGQPMIEIVNDEITAQLAAADASIAEAQADLLNCEQKAERYAKLMESDAISAENYDAAIAGRDAARARLKNYIAQKDRIVAQQDKLTVTAPKDAEVLNVYCKFGYYVRATEPLVMLADTEEMIVTAVLKSDAVQSLLPLEESAILEVPSYLLAHKAYPMARVNENDDIKLNQFHIKFSNVVPSLNSRTEFHKITWLLQNTSGILDPTTYQHARIIAGKARHVLTIPCKAVSQNGDEPYVYVVNDNNTLARRSVKTGITDGEFIEITEGVAEGERVVISQNVELEEGMRVRTKDEGEMQ
jgi:RND family efflux transporter MFP subunit